MVFRGPELEFNAMTKYFYTDRSVPKKKLSEAQMVEMNRLYRIIATYNRSWIRRQSLSRPEDATSGDSTPGDSTAVEFSIRRYIHRAQARRGGWWSAFLVLLLASRSVSKAGHRVMKCVAVSQAASPSCGGVIELVSSRPSFGPAFAGCVARIRSARKQREIRNRKPPAPCVRERRRPLHTP